MKRRISRKMRHQEVYLVIAACVAEAVLGLVALLQARQMGQVGQPGLTLLIGCSIIAFTVMVWQYAVELRRNLIIRREIERLISEEEDVDYLPPEERERLGQMSDAELLDLAFRQMHEASASHALKTEAELHALQNQINPHFLYNTLEIIRSRAMRHGSDDVAEMVEALGMLFRYCINSPGELATLAQELDNVHDYLLIQRYRYGDRFTYQEIIEDNSEAVMNSSLPVMTLQPLIENALVHGINPKTEGGSIILRVECLRDRLQIVVEDDGIGVAEEELRRVRHSLRESDMVQVRAASKSRSVGIAMQNVNQRIRFYFGMQYGVDVASTQGIGTSVTVTLPRISAGRNADES